MDSINIELPGSVVSAVEQVGDDLHIRFQPAYLIKYMTGSRERTRWHQNGVLVFSDARREETGDLPAFPATCRGGDVGENIYTYRDMIPVPLESRGSAHCVLRFEGHEAVLQVQAAGVMLRMDDVPRYIEHIRPESAPE